MKANLIAVMVAAALATAPVSAQEKIVLKVIGQPLATGLIQKNKEQPFFENFAAKTGLPIDADYKPMDTLGIKDTEQLRVMKSGLFDIVSLRVSQNSRDEPAILGLDLVGASPDYATGRQVPPSQICLRATAAAAATMPWRSTTKTSASAWRRQRSR